MLVMLATVQDDSPVWKSAERSGLNEKGKYEVLVARTMCDFTLPRMMWPKSSTYSLRRNLWLKTRNSEFTQG